MDDKKIKWNYISIFIIIDLCLCIVLILTYKLSDNSDVVTNIGFAGTLISIILGTLAIIYSMVQNSSMSNSNAKIVESTDKIEKASYNLENLLNGVTEIQGNITERQKEILQKQISYDKGTNDIIPQKANNKDTPKVELKGLLEHSASHIIYIIYYLYKLEKIDRFDSLIKFEDYNIKNKYVIIDPSTVMAVCFIFQSLNILYDVEVMVEPFRLKVKVNSKAKIGLDEWFENYKNKKTESKLKYEISKVDEYFEIYR